MNIYRLKFYFGIVSSIFYCEKDLGKHKAPLLADRLKQMNHSISVIPHMLDIMEDSNFSKIVSSSNIIIDCLDSIKTRTHVGALAESHGKQIIHGRIRGWFGQLAIFMPYKTPSMATM